MAQQYRCIACQTVYPTVEDWHKHANGAHPEAVGRAAGFVGDPPAEESADPNSDEVQRGILLIIADKPNVGKRGLHNDVWAAIRAGVAVDSDPYWYMSDAYNVYPQARLTAAGERVADERGYRTKCTDHRDNGGACRRYVLASLYGGPGDGRCSSCASSLSQFGAPPPIDGVPALCGMCTVTIMRETRDPNYVVPRDRSHSRYGYR